MLVRLDTPEDSMALGAALARALLAGDPCLTVLMEGPLGAGKTTLIRGLVQALPGSEDARVSSPSFNIVNLYPTSPETAHCDLYRLEGLPPDESVLELMREGRCLVLAEWSQHLARKDRPEIFLRLIWEQSSEARLIRFEARGSRAEECLARLEKMLKKDPVRPEMTP